MVQTQTCTIIKPFPLKFTNSVGYQDEKTVNGAVMILKKYSEFARAALEWIQNNDYKPNSWQIWGPSLITHLVKNRFPDRPDIVHAKTAKVFQPIRFSQLGENCFLRRSGAKMTFMKS